MYKVKWDKKQIIKTSYNPFVKGHGIHGKKKKKKIVFKNKTETGVANKIFFGGAHEFCFTNMKTVLQKYIPNKLIIYFYS